MTAQRRAEILLLAATVVWGSTFVVTKGILTETTPLYYTSVRFLIAALLIVLLFARRVRGLVKAAVKHGAVLGIFLFVGFALQTIGLNYTTASKSAFFTGMLVVFTPIIHYLGQKALGLPRKILRLGNLIGVVCSAGGLFLLTSPDGGGFNLGDGLTLISAALFACYIVYLDWCGREVDKMQLTFVTFLFCGVAGGVLSPFFEEIVLTLNARFTVPLLYLIIFATVIALGVQNRYQGDTTPTRAAVIFAFEPVIAAVFAYYFMGENIGVAGIAGGAVILVGLLVSELSDNLPVISRPILQRPTDG